MKKKTILTVCLGVVFFINVFAEGIKDDIASGVIPLPSDAKPFSALYGSAAQMSMPSPLAIYTTSLSKRQLINFYIKELGKRGWESSGTIRRMIEKYNVPLQGANQARVKKNLDNAVEFHNSSKSLLLFILPSTTTEKKTIFSLGYIQQFPLTTPPSINTLPDYIPVYPGAVLTNRVGNGFVYSTEDNIYNVINFYHNSMLSYGWELYEELPLTEKKIQLPQSIMSNLSQLNKQCPTCEQNTSSMPEEYKRALSRGTSIARAMYKFRRNGELCHITVSSVKIGETYKGTSIMINYNP